MDITVMRVVLRVFNDKMYGSEDYGKATIML